MVYEDDKASVERENIDIAVQAYLTAHGVDEDTQGDLDYNEFDEAISDLLDEAKRLKRLLRS
jgi:hypothetical protein